MEDEGALDLLQRFLEKRGVDCRQLAGLVAVGRAKSCFRSTESWFEVAAWRNLGDVLRDMVIDDDKAAEKLLKPWGDVINAIKRYRVERNLAAVAPDGLRGGKGEPGSERGRGQQAAGRAAPRSVVPGRFPAPRAAAPQRLHGGKRPSRRGEIELRQN